MITERCLSQEASGACKAGHLPPNRFVLTGLLCAMSSAKCRQEDGAHAATSMAMLGLGTLYQRLCGDEICTPLAGPQNARLAGRKRTSSSCQQGSCCVVHAYHMSTTKRLGFCTVTFECSSTMNAAACATLISPSTRLCKAQR